MKPLIVLVGPSCSGKTTLAQHLQTVGPCQEAVSLTTRPMRSGEKHGVNYYYITNEEMDELGTKKALLEEVTFNGNRYAASVAEVDRITEEGGIPMIVAEPGGAEMISEFCRDTMEENGFLPVLIHVDCPMALTRDRFIERGLADIAEAKGTKEAVETAADMVAKRLLIAESEEQYWQDMMDYDANVGPMINGDSTRAAVQVIKKHVQEITEKGAESTTMRQYLRPRAGEPIPPFNDKEERLDELKEWASKELRMQNGQPVSQPQSMSQIGLNG